MVNYTVLLTESLKICGYDEDPRKILIFRYVLLKSFQSHTNSTKSIPQNEYIWPSYKLL